MTIEDQALQQTVLDSEAFFAWRSELQDFAAETHQRLQSLLQSLAKAQQENVPAINQGTQQMHSDSVIDAVTTADEDPASQTADQAEQTVTEPDEPTTNPPVSDVVEGDPIERLDAIKRRLASQMQNAS